MNKVFFMLTQSTSTSQTVSLFSIQAANIMKISKDVLLITTDDLNIKAELAFTNDPCWVSTYVSNTSPT